jgi:hypothetical protein
MRIMQTVHWQGKNYPMPFDVNLELDKGQEIEVRNRFSGELVSFRGSQLPFMT